MLRWTSLKQALHLSFSPAFPLGLSVLEEIETAPPHRVKLNCPGLAWGLFADKAILKGPIGLYARGCSLMPLGDNWPTHRSRLPWERESVGRKEKRLGCCTPTQQSLALRACCTSILPGGQPQAEETRIQTWWVTSTLIWLTLCV